MENSILLHTGNQFYPKLPFLTLWPKNLSLVHGSIREQMWRIKRVKAIGESSDESDDALQVTIEKSKKVLAMQQDLLQQIAERRKVVSSIKCSLADAKGTYDGGNGSLSDDDIPEADKDYNVTLPSAVTTPNTDVEENSAAPISQDFIESEREDKKGPGAGRHIQNQYSEGSSIR